MSKKNKPPVRTPSGPVTQQSAATPTRGTASVTVSRQLSGWAGPLPQPSDLAAYEAIVPGCAKQIIGWAEEEGNARRENTRYDTVWSNRREWFGMTLSFLFAITLLVAGVYLLHDGKQIGGFAALLATIAPTIVALRNRPKSE